MLRNIKLHIEADYTAMSKKAADIFAAIVDKFPNHVYGFATGSTPEGMYKELARLAKYNRVDFTGITTFNPSIYTQRPRSGAT